MSISILRAFVATTVACSVAGVGCAAQTASEEAPARESEGTVAQVAQQLGENQLYACENDVPTSGFLVLPYNQLNYTVGSGWKSGCVGFRVNRNLPYPQNVPGEEEALGDFPQFEGTWTSAKDAQCRASYIEGAWAQKPLDSGDWSRPNDNPISPLGFVTHAAPEVVYDQSSPTQFRIKSCTAQIRRSPGGGCTYTPKYNYQRIDVHAVVNGIVSNAAKVYVRFSNTTSC